MSLKRFLCDQIPTPNRATLLSEEEARHAIKVYRLQQGDRVEVLDGQGHAVIASLRLNSQGVWLDYIEPSPLVEESVPSSNPRVSPSLILEVAILKGEAMEWVIEKAVELGCAEVHPLLTAHTVVQIDRKGPEAFQGRWQKIADQALKQCGRTQRLLVGLPTPLEQKLSESASRVEPQLNHDSAASPNAQAKLRLWADESARSLDPGLHWISAIQHKITQGEFASIHLLIGPEGGWSTAEREILRRAPAPGFTHQVIGLGPLILRAETAALASLSLLRFFSLQGSPNP
jgi:16S rRNA (uracil1498-N3)-methyltransferase